MRILFVHSNFPGQYQKLAPALARDPVNRVVFATQEAHGSIPGVEKRLYAPMRQPRADIHHYVRPLEQAVLNGQALYRLCRQLTARFESQGAGRRFGFGCTRRWSLRRIMARVTMASETSGSSS